MLFSFESSIHGFSTFSVLITLYSFESYMEWKYDRESKVFDILRRNYFINDNGDNTIFPYLIHIDYNTIVISYNEQL